MDSLNKQERTEAIIKMLAFFLLAVIIVAIPMYYAFALPEKEKALNEAEYKNLVSELEEIDNFELEFLTKTDSAISLFMAFKNEEDELNRDKIQLRYSGATNQMEDYLEKIRGDTIKSRLYDNIIFTYNNLFSAWSEKYDLQIQLDECMKSSSAKSAAVKEGKEKVTIENEKSIRQKEIDLMNKALEKHNGSIRLAGKELGLTERKMKKRMEELGII